MTSLEGLLNMGYLSGAGHDMFRFGGMKLFVDGTGGDALGNRYDDVKWTQDELNHLLSSADAAGIQTIMHVVTDGGLRMATTAIEETRRRNAAKPYLVHRIEHGADRGGLDALRHLRDLGIRISVTPGKGRRGATRPRYKTLVREDMDPVPITDTQGRRPVRPRCCSRSPAPRCPSTKVGALQEAKSSASKRLSGSLQREMHDVATKIVTRDPSQSASWVTSPCSRAIPRR